jgi:hypothetical protein
MAPTGRKRDILDQHIDVAERIRKLEVMSQGLTLRPRDWRAKDSSSSDRLDILTELVIALSFWGSPGDSSAAPTPYATLSRRARGLRDILFAEGWKRLDWAYDWTYFLTALRAIPPKFNSYNVGGASDLYWEGRPWGRHLPPPVLPHRDLDPVTHMPLPLSKSLPVASFVVPTHQNSSYDYKTNPDAKWLMFFGFPGGGSGGGAYRWTAAGTNLGPPDVLLREGQTGLAPVPDMGMTIPTDIGDFEVWPAGAYVYEVENQSLQFTGMDNASYYSGFTGEGTFEIEDCGNLEEGATTYDNVPRVNPAQAHGYPVAGIIGWGCQNNLVDHEVDIGGGTFIYEFLGPVDLVLVYPPMFPHGQGGESVRQDFDVNWGYPGWTVTRAYIEALLPYFPGVAHWYESNINRIRPFDPKWQDLPFYIRNETGRVQAQVRDRNVHFRGSAHRWATWNSSSYIGFIDTRYVPPPAQLPWYLGARTELGHTAFIRISGNTAPYEHLLTMTVSRIEGEFSDDPGSIVPPEGEEWEAADPMDNIWGGRGSHRIFLDGLSYPADLTLY